jgi:phosphoribosylglycinamide formyltransferase 1
MEQTEKIKVAIMASGSGTNAQNLIRYFRGHDKIDVTLVITNRPDAFVLQRAKDENVPSLIIPIKQWNEKEFVLEIFNNNHIDFLILAGYLMLLPPWLVALYPNRIINIHPALLPKYGGKGMYGDRVHQAVIESGDKVSGITIHYVNEEYDSGNIIFQAQCVVLPDDTPKSLASRIHQLEYEHYPRIAEEVIMSNV